MHRITFRADRELIALARKKASARGSTLSAEFRRWLADYTAPPAQAGDLAALMERLRYAQPGGAFSREEANAR